MENKLEVLGKEVIIDGVKNYVMHLNLYDAIFTKVLSLDLADDEEVPEAYVTTFLMMLEIVCNETKCRFSIGEDGDIFILSRKKKRFDKAVKLLEPRLMAYFNELVI